jgi:RHS repeat-associated protein
MKMRRLLFCCLLAVLAGRPLSAQDEVPTQVTAQNRSGDLPFSVTIGADIEKLDMIGGTPLLRLPILHLPGRKMGYDFDLIWDARFLVTVQRTPPGAAPFEFWNIEQRGYLPQFDQGLWSSNLPRISYVTSSGACNTDLNGQTGHTDDTSNYIYHDSTGAKHPLRVSTTQAECNEGTYSINNARGPALSGSGIVGTLDPDGTGSVNSILFPDGTQNLAGGALGNPINIGPGAFAGEVSAASYLDVYGNAKQELPGGSDTLGRTMLTRQDSANQTVFTVHDAPGNPQNYTVNYTDLQLKTAFNLQGIYGLVREYSGTRKAISSVVLPNGLSYKFKYDNYGMITEIDFPAGATITYAWDNDLDLRVRWVTSRTLTVGNQTSKWTFQRQHAQPADCNIVTLPGFDGGCRQVTVTDPQQNQSVYAFLPGSAAGITHARIYQGAATGTPLREYAIDYFLDVNPGSVVSLPKSITTTLDNGLVSQKTFTYDQESFDFLECTQAPWQCAQDPTQIRNLGTTTSNGNVLTIKEYGFGEGAPGRLIRTTTNEYLHNANANYLAPNIVDKIIRQTITDGSGATAAKTEYEYDNATQTGPFLGSATKVSQLRNTDGAMLATTYAYDSFGNIISITDPKLNQTTFSYDDNWVTGSTNCLPPANSHGYVTQRTNALGQRTKFTRYPCTGQIQAHQDENDLQAKRAGTTFTYDLMNRPLITAFPHGGQTSYSYKDAAPMTITKTVKASPAPDVVSIVHLDDLGRTAQTQFVDPEGDDLVDTAYDAFGRVSSVSNPHRSTALPTDGVTQTRYDALNRVIDVIKQDGSIVHTAYDGNIATVIDETGRVRRSVTDALGRLVEVDEPAAGSPPGSPGAVARSAGVISGNEQFVLTPASNFSFSAAPSSQTASQGARTSFTISIAPPSGDTDTMNLSVSGLPQGATYRLSPTSVSGSGSSTLTITVGGSTQTGSYNLTITGDSPSYSATATVTLTVTINPAVLMAIINNILLADSPASASMAATKSSSLASSSTPAVKVSGPNGATPVGRPIAPPPTPRAGATPAVAAPTPAANTAAGSQPNAVYFKNFDAGSVWITVQGFKATARYGQGSTASSVADDLASQFNSPGSPVSAFVTGANLSLFANDSGAGGNHAIDAQGATSDLSGTFSQPSFAVSVPGLSGGADPSANLDGTSGSSSISISGSVAVVGTIPASYASGSVTVSGMEQSTVPPCPPPPQECGGDQNTIYDSGEVTITVNGNPDFSVYGQVDTSSTVASGLAQAIGNDSNAPVTVSLSGNTISLKSKAAGSGGNYSLSCSTRWDSSDFLSPSFTGNTSGSSLTGGRDSSPIYDSGTLTVTVNGFQASAPYNQNLNSTASAMAQALANALNASDSPVTASASGTTITITARDVGEGTNYTVNGSSTASFTASSTTLSGGTDLAGPYPPYVTLYQYDVLGNLLSVNQQGDGSQPARVRNFTYDSLSHLLTAQNVESGLITYSYDANGNVTSKTDARGVTITYDPSDRRIDALNRVTKKTYSNGQTAVTYSYDQGADGIGHLTGVTDPAGSASYTYDAMGRISNEQRTIAGVTKSLGYTYNLDSSISTVTYPSGAVVTYTQDSAGRALSAVDIGNSTNYATHASYGPDNALTGFVSGDTITNSFSYNNRLQPLTMAASAPQQKIFDLTYDFHEGNGDNGNVFGITNNRDNTRSQSFTYDALNRLISAQNAGTDCSQLALNGGTKFWGNNYVYDSWGNLLQKIPTKSSPQSPAQCKSENLMVTADAQNRIHANSAPDYGYDAAGNMTQDASTGNSYRYDAENRITGTGGFTYTYDADGNRVEKSNGSTGTIYWYMTPGIVGESDLRGNLTSEYVFFDGERVARKDFSGNTTSVSYYFSDHLKTASVITDSVGNIKEDEDYFPWGAEVKFVDNDSNHYKFTGKERDTETGLDYFGARYYGNWLGRFTTPDWAETAVPIPYATPTDPQSLNQYTYVRNLPTSQIDENGHYDMAGSGACQRQRFCQQQQDGGGQSQSGGQSQTGRVASNVAVGVGKELFNQAVDLVTLAGKVESKLSGTDFDTSLFPTFNASNKTEKITMTATGILVLLVPGAGEEAGAAKVIRTISKGEKVEALMNELLALTHESGGMEHAIVTLKNGERLIVAGSPTGISFGSLSGQIRRIIIHTHPETTGGASAKDVTAIRTLGQKSSWLYEFFGGGLSKFRSWMSGK